MIPDDPSVIKPILTLLKKSFSNRKTIPLSFRKQQLLNLKKGALELESEILAAFMKDLGYKSSHYPYILSMGVLISEIDHTLSHFESWAEKESVGTSLLVGPGQSYIVPEPLGVTLVIGAWNFPFNTGVCPAVTAIAAGNCVVLKPSEMSPHSSNIIKKLFDNYLDKECYQVIEGQLEISKTICYNNWDHIIFTGSPQKGKLIAKAAAENLIPTILELGGKNPTIVDRTANLDTTASRIIWGKLQNAGQVCLAPDYLFVDESIVDTFLEKMKNKILEMTENDPSKSVDYGRLVNEFHANRMKQMLESHGGTIYYGGNYNVDQKYVQPTIILNPKLDSECVKDEIFGPLLLVFTYKDFNEVVTFINEREKPLVLYYYGENKKHQEQLINHTSSGAICFNESLMHYINHALPFGGVGNSGYGYLHGRIGFNNCSHLKSVLDKSGVLGNLNGFPFNLRFPPFSDSKYKRMRFLSSYFNFCAQDIVKTKAFLSVAVIIPSAIGFYLFGGF